MQVPPDPSPFLLAQLDDALPGRLELVGEADRMHRRCHLWRQVGDQSLVPLRESTALPSCEPKLADRDPLVHEGDAKAPRGRRAVFRHDLPLHDECCVLQGERLADRLDDGRQHRGRAGPTLVRLRPSRAIAA